MDADYGSLIARQQEFVKLTETWTKTLAWLKDVHDETLGTISPGGEGTFYALLGQSFEIASRFVMSRDAEGMLEVTMSWAGGGEQIRAARWYWSLRGALHSSPENSQDNLLVERVKEMPAIDFMPVFANAACASSAYQPKSA